MSCHYDVYCLDCDDNLGIQDANHRNKEMHALIKLAPAIVAFKRVMDREEDAFQDSGLEIEVTILWGKRLDLKWFVQHEGHALMVRDEYGHLHDECGAYFNCEACNHRERCQRPARHDGPHSKERDKTK